MLPQEFIRRTKELLHDEYDALESALESRPAVSFRINPHKFPANLQHNLQNPAGKHPDILSTEYKKVPWCETGYFLPERPLFTADPLFHAGAYYVQEASSMFLEQALLKIMAEEAGTSREGFVALDLCAAPGGKSTHLRSLLPEGSLLVSNEIIRSRSVILSENMTKWGRPGNIVTNSDPEDFGKLKHLFDIILADLPCSGEGMFRKDTASRSEWSADNVKRCASRQRRIIFDVWDALKPGGWLIYCTCTFNTEENEDNVHSLAGELGAETVTIPVKPEWNITGSLHHDMPAYRFFPHRTCGEGFFLALMRKNNGADDADRIKTKYKNSRQPVIAPPEIKCMLSEPDRFIFLADGKTATAAAPGKSANAGNKHPPARNNQTAGYIYALPGIHKNTCALLAGTLNIISAGIRLGELKGNDFTPSVSLALSTEINPEAFFSVELSYENALKYLQKEAIVLPGNTPKGYILVTYGKTPLGFVKNIGNRANNLYPPEWRIRKKIV
ncbi:MAG: rRNA cytosine-C5-methyltransferase [Tannerella sp.]|jgi:16S rRNA C967 or C1407 C5-methylase (RsmB/RsmF family)/NOL1/NOP2/fmu family ribosome biogenesis protein|nr:rRNA cytosine-C5-methyltransferase [Tannerella sp.]